MATPPDLILDNGRFATLDRANPTASATPFRRHGADIARTAAVKRMLASMASQLLTICIENRPATVLPETIT